MQPRFEPRFGQAGPTAERRFAERTYSPAGGDDATRMMRYDAAKKSTGLAYVLWFFVGALGIHRFYLSRPLSGLCYLLLLAVAIPTFGLALIVTAFWLLLDLFFIPGIARSYNERLIRRLA